MNTICGGSVQACATRLARLNQDGSFNEGDESLYVSDALITFGWEPELSVGEDFEQKNACGKPCVTYKDCDRLKRLNTTIEVCTVDPELHEMIIGDGSTVLRDLNGDTRGFAMPLVGEETCPFGVSAEIWTKNIVDGEQHDDFPWIRWVFPRVKHQLGARTIGNEVMTHPFSGQASQNVNWGSGPAGDWDYISNRLGLFAFEEDIPVTECGYQELVVGS